VEHVASPRLPVCLLIACRIDKKDQNTRTMTRDEKRIAHEITSGLDRRHFLRATGAAALAALAGSEPKLYAATKLSARADSVILLWMAGGMAQTETFDPKRYTPMLRAWNRTQS
jgi:hypothetical protein